MLSPLRTTLQQPFIFWLTMIHTQNISRLNPFSMRLAADHSSYVSR
jgi:hypothetical protein